MLNSYHLVVDLVEVNLADLVHNVLALERHKGETCFCLNHKCKIKKIFKYLETTIIDGNISIQS